MATAVAPRIEQLAVVVLGRARAAKVTRAKAAPHCHGQAQLIWGSF